MKRKGLKVILPLLVLGICAAAAFYMLGNADRQEAEEGQETRGRKNNSGITASGTTMVGIVEDKYDIDFLEDELYIEEVLVSGGDIVEEGSKILKFSESSVSAAQKQLEKAATITGLDYRSGKIDYEKSKQEAENTYKQSILNGSLAQGIYEDAVTGIEGNILTLQSEEADKQAELQEYQNALEQNSYYTDYKVEELKKVFQENYALLYKKLAEWDISETQITSGSGNTSAGSETGGTGGNTSSGGGNQLSAETRERIQVLGLFKSLVDENKTEYEKAEENYEQAKETASLQSIQMTQEIKALQLQIKEAQLNKESALTAAKAEYESSMAKAEAAKNIYDTTVKKLKEKLEALEDDQKDALSNLSHFEEMAGSGYFCASNNGTVMKVGSRKNTNIAEDTLVLTYSNPDTVSVTAAVDQSNIAALNIGDKVQVMIADQGSFEAVITEMIPTASSRSQTSVTYKVTVTLEGDISGLTVNLSAEVIFTAGEESEAMEGNKEVK